jgi:uncharacterized protein (DUF4415 family)
MSGYVSKKKSETDWENLSKMPDTAINMTDNPELDASFFENAELRMPKPKKAVSLRLDDDILHWFQQDGKGYQTRINAVLRLYMQARSCASTVIRSSSKRPYRHHATTKSITRQ